MRGFIFMLKRILGSLILLGVAVTSLPAQVRFSAPINTSTGGVYPSCAATGDFNRDGKPDLFIGGNGSSSVMLGRGDGTFVAPTVQNNGPIGTAPAVALGDFNGDGLLDAATANRIDNSVGILLGNGDGTFKPYTA